MFKIDEIKNHEHVRRPIVLIGLTTYPMTRLKLTYELTTFSNLYGWSRIPFLISTKVDDHLIFDLDNADDVLKILEILEIKQDFFNHILARLLMSDDDVTFGVKTDREDDSFLNN